MQPRDAGIRIKQVDYRHVDVMIHGKTLIDGRMVPREDAVKLIQEFARKFGPVIVETEQLDHRVVQDVVRPDGTVEPFLSIAGATQNAETHLNTSLVDSIERAVSTGEVQVEDTADEVPTFSLVASLDWVDVEGEMAKIAAGTSIYSPAPHSVRDTHRPGFTLPKWALPAAGAAAVVVGGAIYILS